MQFGSESTGPARFLRVVCSGWLTTHGAEIQKAFDRALRRRRDGHRALSRFGVGSIPAPIQHFLHRRWNDWCSHRRSCFWRRCRGLGDEAGRPVIGDLPMGAISTALSCERIHPRTEPAWESPGPCCCRGRFGRWIDIWLKLAGRNFRQVRRECYRTTSSTSRNHGFAVPTFARFSQWRPFGTDWSVLSRSAIRLPMRLARS